ncbi:GlsB/YeaQ/YmgE family stress response membrane protein [Candidatus Parcubacteria bacterium]|nr:GlsB/YeaQ/YmgE family stress response membrane protein [Candidatus Parcubacteria bacterium]
MSIIVWIIFGGLVGWIASIIMKTNAQQGIIANIVVGIVGALLGGFLAQALGIGAVTGFNIMSFIIALMGAVILLGIVRMFTGSRQL